SLGPKRLGPGGGLRSCPERPISGPRFRFATPSGRQRTGKGEGGGQPPLWMTVGHDLQSATSGGSQQPRRQPGKDAETPGMGGDVAQGPPLEDFGQASDSAHASDLAHASDSAHALDLASASGAAFSQLVPGAFQ